MRVIFIITLVRKKKMKTLTLKIELAEYINSPKFCFSFPFEFVFN